MYDPIVRCGDKDAERTHRLGMEGCVSDKTMDLRLQIGTLS